MSKEHSMKKARCVACTRPSLPKGMRGTVLWPYTVGLEANGANVAFAFSTPTYCDRFVSKITDDNGVSRCPLNIVAKDEIDALCAWFALDAESPYDEILWIVSRDEFVKAVTELLKMKEKVSWMKKRKASMPLEENAANENKEEINYIELLCEEYRRRGIEKNADEDRRGGTVEKG